jgi:citrate synthase
MPTRDMLDWETEISKVVSNNSEEEIVVRGHRMSDLIGNTSFAGMMFLLLQGRLPRDNEARVLDALLVASAEHGIAPPSMIARCFASYGTSIQAAVGGGIIAFGDRMGGLGEELAKLMSETLATLAEGAGEAVEELCDEALATAACDLVERATVRGERVPGYGIPLHGLDPRSPQVLAVAKRENTFGAHCRFAQQIEVALANSRGGRTVPLNLDGVSAAIALDLGFSWRTTRMFLLTPRSVSMGAHFLEEQAQDSTWRHISTDRIHYQDPSR